MYAVTLRAAYLGMTMRGAPEVRVRFGVAGQTAGVDLVRGCLLEEKYLRFVAASGHVIRAGSVASLASLVRGFAMGIECCFPVRRIRETVVKRLMAALACI